MADADTTPVIVGVGEVKDRPADPADGLEPAVLAEHALRRAEADAGARLLHRMDSLDVVGVVSWPYDDLPAQLARAVAAHPARLRHGPIGGQTPVQFLHEAAQRIARGESAVAAVCGAESSHTATQAARRGLSLPWTEPAAGRPAQGSIQGSALGGAAWLPARNRGYLHPLALRHGITEPVTVYPLYEGATAAAWGQTPAQATAQSAALWAELSETAARTPGAWLQAPRRADEIMAVSPGNRMVAWPYPKLMVANPAVNQGAAVLLTSLAAARAAGISPERLIHVQGGASAAEPMDWMARDSFAHASGMAAVLDAVTDGGSDAFDVLELYSCFPVVPKMALRHMGLPPGTPVSAAGGLTFHGAPLNNYMTHAAVAVVGALRAAGTRALLYGQGGYLTWHHALVLGREPARAAVLRGADRQADAVRRRGPAPLVVEDAGGPAILEAFTIPFRPDGSPDFAAAVLRLPGGARTLARVPAADTGTLARLMSPGASPIGTEGIVSAGSGGLLEWRA